MVVLHKVRKIRNSQERCNYFITANSTKKQVFQLGTATRWKRFAKLSIHTWLHLAHSFKFQYKLFLWSGVLAALSWKLRHSSVSLSLRLILDQRWVFWHRGARRIKASNRVHTIHQLHTHLNFAAWLERSAKATAALRGSQRAAGRG